MKDEFNKLDTFMRAHRPAALPTRPARLPQEAPGWLPLASLASVFLVILIVTGVYWQESNRNNEAYALVETMEWELDADVEPEDIGDLIAIAE